LDEALFCFRQKWTESTHELSYNSAGDSPLRNPRKKYKATEKVPILRRHLIDRVPVSDLCDEYQLRPTLFYLWQKSFFENGTPALERKHTFTKNQHQRTIAALQDNL